MIGIILGIIFLLILVGIGVGIYYFFDKIKCIFHPKSCFECDPKCSDTQYCNILERKCKAAENPGAGCLARQHNQCKGESKCILSSWGAHCSAGQDGINPPGSAGNPPDKHYTALGTKGCSAVIPCPPGYYCKIGSEPCKAAQNPGAGCLAGQHNQCKGESHCILGTRGAKCSAGRDGKNPPGIAGNPDNEHYQALGYPGCGPATHCVPSYYCPVGNGPCVLKKTEGQGCDIVRKCIDGLHCQLRGGKLICVSGKKEGDHCDVNHKCGVGSYCQRKLPMICKQKHKEGEGCPLVGGSYQCMEGLKCHNGKCVKK